MPSSLSDFDVLYTIGSGSYGTCKKVRRKSDGKIFVWKEMDYGSMTETEKQMLVSEVNLLRELKHENIVRYHERVVDKKRQVLYLIMEYCEGGDLAAVIKRYDRDGRYFDEEMVWKTLAQCASALNECHKRKDGKSILHRDLKPANIFLDAQKNVKLGDFGLARVLHETSFAKTFVGTPYYMSPEQMNKLSYNEKSDIWSLGCVLYEMCTLRPPFLASNQRELALKIRMGQFARLPSRYSSDLAKVLNKMLNVECNERPSIESLLSMAQVKRHTGTSDRSASGETSSWTKAITELIEREKKCMLAENKLKEREAAIKERESQLDKLERDFEQRLAIVQEKEERLANNGYDLVRKGLHTQNMNTGQKKLANYEDKTHKSITPILCHAKRPPDSPSKHVSFEAPDGKENVGETKYLAHREKEANLLFLRGRERTDTEYQRRKELRDRLEKAKQRATQLRALNVDSKLRGANLLVVG